MPDPREAKLPKWAQDLILGLRERSGRAERKLAEHHAETPKTRIWYGDYGNPLYVPEQWGHQRVHFDMGDGEYDLHRNGIQVGITGKGLEVMCGRAMLIRPQVSNVIRIQLDPEG